MRWVLAFRFGSVVNVLAMITQALFAGEILSGKTSGPALHLAMAKFLVICGAFQLAAAFAMRRKDLCPRSLLIAVAGVLAAEILEFGLGEFHNLLLHVPLGVAIFGGAVRQLLWSTQQKAEVVEGA